VFNNNDKILVEKLSSHLNGPEFDIVPYMTLCTLDSICGKSETATTALKLQSAFHEKVPAGGEGGGSGAVMGESLLLGGLKGCYWWKTV
jgi:hypothetical protein